MEKLGLTLRKAYKHLTDDAKRVKGYEHLPLIKAAYLKLKKVNKKKH